MGSYPPEITLRVVLPGMGGIELAITVRRVFPECKIILFSGQASTADLLASANKRGHRFSLLNKPIHPADLLARVTETISFRRQHMAAGAV